jgi:hypothetical protein
MYCSSSVSLIVVLSVTSARTTLLKLLHSLRVSFELSELFDWLELDPVEDEELELEPEDDDELDEFCAAVLLEDEPLEAVEDELELAASAGTRAVEVRAPCSTRPAVVNVPSASAKMPAVGTRVVAADGLKKSAFPQVVEVKEGSPESPSVSHPAACIAVTSA